MGCPIAMGRSMSADASSHRFVCARVPQSGCNGDFVIDNNGNFIFVLEEPVISSSIIVQVIDKNYKSYSIEINENS